MGDLTEVVIDAYDDQAIVDGYVKLTESIASALDESLNYLGYNSSEFNVGSCGVYLGEMLSQTVDPRGALCHFEDGCNCTSEIDVCHCQAPTPLCVLVTNIEVLGSSTTYQDPSLDQFGETTVATAFYDNERVEVEFIIATTHDD